MEPKRRDGREARRDLPCPACGRASRCVVYPTGACWCYRVESTRPRTDKNGCPGWVHLPDGERPASKWEPEFQPERLPADRLAICYEHLLQQLSLNREHRQHLREVRGLSDEAIEGYGFRSIPHPAVAAVIAAQVAQSHADWERIPGLANRAGKPRLVCGANPGILIPCRDLDGRIGGFRLRLDHPPEGTGKYRWLSGGGGPSCGSIPSWWPAPTPQTRLRVCEGEIKASILAQYKGLPCIATPGCQDLASPQVVEWLRLLKPELVLLTIDPDSFWNGDVGSAVDRACNTLRRLPYPFQVEVFPWS